MNWLTRTDLAKHAWQTSHALLFANEPGEEFLPLNAEGIKAAQAISALTINKLGFNRKQRVLVALNQTSSAAVTLLAQTIATSGANVALTNPRGRMRLLSTLRSLKPNVLIMTSCGAMDFLARLYIEFNVDPEELGITHIVLVGEIPSEGACQRISREFSCQVSQLYCDPFFGVALAIQQNGQWQEGEPGIIRLAPLTENKKFDKLLSDSIDQYSEIVIDPTWSTVDLLNTTLRTGQVVAPSVSSTQSICQRDSLFQHTLGEHVMVRGLWLSLPRLRRCLTTIDGVASLTLEIFRGEGTLDSATLTVGFNRSSLVENPMWKKRLSEAVSSATAISIQVKTELIAEQTTKQKETVIDHRGHHLGVDRKNLFLPETVE